MRSTHSRLFARRTRLRLSRKNVFGARRRKRHFLLHSHALDRHGVLHGSLCKEAADDVVVAGGAQSGAASAGLPHQLEGFCKRRKGRALLEFPRVLEEAKSSGTSVNFSDVTEGRFREPCALKWCFISSTVSWHTSVL